MFGLNLLDSGGRLHERHSGLRGGGAPGAGGVGGGAGGVPQEDGGHPQQESSLSVHHSLHTPERAGASCGGG